MIQKVILPLFHLCFSVGFLLYGRPAFSFPPSHSLLVWPTNILFHLIICYSVIRDFNLHIFHIWSVRTSLHWLCVHLTWPRHSVSTLFRRGPRKCSRFISYYPQLCNSEIAQVPFSGKWYLEAKIWVQILLVPGVSTAPRLFQWTVVRKWTHIPSRCHVCIHFCI